MPNFLRSTLLSTTLLSLTAGAALAERGADGRLDVLYWQAVSILNPYLSSGTKDLHGASVVLEPFARYEPDGTLVPLLVTGIPTVENGGVSADLTSITWTIAPGLLWSDGTPLTAEDAVFTWQYCMADGSGCGQAASFADVAAVEALDAQTVRVTFTGPKPFPYGPFVSAFSPILQKAQFADCLGPAATACSDQNFAPIGTGPFRVTEFSPNDVAVFEANPNYRDPAKPAFGTLVLRGGGDAASAARAVFTTGEVDYAWNLLVPPDVLAQAEADGKGVLETAFGTTVEFLTLNLTNPDPALGALRSTVEGGPHPFLADPAVQRALSLAVDRDLIVEASYGATGRPTCNLAAAPEVYASTANDWCLVQDLAEANRLLDAAGWLPGPDGVRAKDGVRMSVSYSTTTNAVRQDTQVLIKSMWEAIGVETTLRNIDGGVFFGGGSDNPDSVWAFGDDILMYADNFTGTDPEPFMASRVCDLIPTPGNNWSGNNIGRFCDAEYDALAAELSATAALAERGRIVKAQNDLLIARGGIVPLVHRANVSGRAKTLEGVRMNAWDSELWNIADWTRAE
jgi:peptide/nickel transport system substrate-binding protein